MSRVQRKWHVGCAAGGVMVVTSVAVVVKVPALSLAGGASVALLVGERGLVYTGARLRPARV